MTETRDLAAGDHEHDWQLWVPMNDGTGRERRNCRGCPMIQTRRGS